MKIKKRKVLTVIKDGKVEVYHSFSEWLEVMGWLNERKN